MAKGCRVIMSTPQQIHTGAGPVPQYVVFAGHRGFPTVTQEIEGSLAEASRARPVRQTRSVQKISIAVQTQKKRFVLAGGNPPRKSPWKGRSRAGLGRVATGRYYGGALVSDDHFYRMYV